MKKQRIYVDTSVIGGCFDEEFLLWSNGLIKDFHLGNYLPVISEIVSAEIEGAPEYVKNQYKLLMSLKPEILEVNEESLSLAEAYQKEKILTPKYYDDGLHIALSTVADIDVLVSWNFKHIVRFDKIRLYNSVNIAFGYKQLQIFSPREVTNYEEKEYKIC